MAGSSRASAGRTGSLGGAQAMKYLIVIEETDSGFSAYSPDIPGCIVNRTGFIGERLV